MSAFIPNMTLPLELQFARLVGKQFCVKVCPNWLYLTSELFFTLPN